MYQVLSGNVAVFSTYNRADAMRIQSIYRQLYNWAPDEVRIRRKKVS